jgi:hypothetical protein
MKLKNTLILLLIAGAIFAFIAFYEKHQPTTLEARERAGRVVQMDRDAVTEISIKNAETKIELRKGENNVWTLNEPVKDRADSMAINQLFTTAEELKHDAMIGDGKGGEKDQLKEFGLANPEIRVKFAGGEKPVELLLGKDAAVEGKIYVKRAMIMLSMSSQRSQESADQEGRRVPRSQADGRRGNPGESRRRQNEFWRDRVAEEG